MQRPSSVQLAPRLRQICDAEAVRIDTKNMLDLCDTMDGDMRACLNALEFVSRKSTSIMGHGRLARLLTGFKDSGRSPLAVWQAIFHGGQDMAALERVVEQADEHEKITTGCFELYLQTRFFDNAAMDKVSGPCPARV